MSVDDGQVVVTNGHTSPLYRVRLPLEPLQTICERRHRGKDTAQLGHLALMSEALGVSRQTIFRWYQKGGVPMVQADRCAVSLGLHPGLIWREWWHV